MRNSQRDYRTKSRQQVKSRFHHSSKASSRTSSTGSPWVSSRASVHAGECDLGVTHLQSKCPSSKQLLLWFRAATHRWHDRQRSRSRWTMIISPSPLLWTAGLKPRLLSVQRNRGFTLCHSTCDAMEKLKSFLDLTCINHWPLFKN